MPALGGPMTYLNEQRVTPVHSSSSPPAAIPSAARSSAAAAAYLSPNSRHHHPSGSSATNSSGSTTTTTTLSTNSHQRHRPFSSSASSTSSDFSLDSAASNNSHLLLPPLPQQPPSSLYSNTKSQAMASYTNAGISYVSHQCPRTGTAFTVQAGQQCSYCNYVVQGYYHPTPQPPQPQQWPPQQYQQPPSYTTSPQTAYYAPTAAQTSYPSPGSTNYSYKPEPSAALQYQASPSPTHMDYAIAHSNQQNQCPHCQRVLGRNADLDRHIESVHTRSKQYQCKYETCDRHTRPFNRYDHLRDHLRKVHGEQIVKTRGPRSSRNQS